MMILQTKLKADCSILKFRPKQTGCEQGNRYDVITLKQRGPDLWPSIRDQYQLSCFAVICNKVELNPI